MFTFSNIHHINSQHFQSVVPSGARLHYIQLALNVASPETSGLHHLHQLTKEMGDCVCPAVSSL